jgi:hypothetical protein
MCCHRRQYIVMNDMTITLKWAVHSRTSHGNSVQMMMMMMVMMMGT